ncbi:MAG: hypothetical protein K6U04_05465 [Armatimonadetes bacterium]|nr:hypothetical protein [Armatimonadota bacterium]
MKKGTSSKKLKVEIHDTTGKKIIGYIENHVFKKNVCKSKHFFTNYSAWAIQEEAIPILRKHNVKLIEIYDKESGTTYRTSLDTFLSYSFVKNWGYGRQLFLPLKFWEVIGPGFEQMRLFA